jgi:virulence factor
MDIVKVGVIGAGRFAQLVILPILKSMPEVQLVGIVSRTEDKVRRVAGMFGIPGCFLTVDDLLRKTKPDCAFVLTPPEEHREPTLQLLDVGIDVFCEKPLASDLRSAEMMVATARQQDRILMVGLNRRYSPACVRARRAFDGKRLEGCVLEKYKRNPDRRPLLNDCIHLIDLMRWFCGGEYTEVSAMGAFDKDPYHEQTVTAIVKFSTGVLGTFFMSRNSGQWKERFELHGGGVTAIVDWPEELRILREGCTEVFDFKPSDWAWAAGFWERGGFQQEVEAFIRCIRTRERPLTDGEEAIKSHRLVWQLYKECGLPLE